MFCLLCKSYTNRKKIFDLGSVAHVSVQGQGHNWRSTISSRSRSPLKVKYINKQILHIMSCPLYNSFNNGRIFFKLELHIYLN